jgi:hypothetical protein
MGKFAPSQMAAVMAQLAGLGLPKWWRNNKAAAIRP